MGDAQNVMQLLQELECNMKILADENIPLVKQCFSTIGQVETAMGKDVCRQMAADADILLVRSVTKVGHELLENSSVKFVATATIGVDHIDQDYLRDRQIGFASAPGSNANSVAEYIVAGILEIAEKLQIQLKDKSIGVVGVGNVGSKVVEKCQALEMKVLLNDPPLARKTGDPKYIAIEEICKCDFITFHTPLTKTGFDKTFHLLNEKLIDSMKDGVVLINSSRGAVADTKALKKAVKAKKIAAMMLDVWEDEPNIDLELVEIADIVTPHIAGYSFDGKIAGMMMIYDAACKYFAVAPQFSIEPFLPSPVVPTLDLNQFDDSQLSTQQIVKNVYNIRNDDQRLRQIANQVDRGAYFTKLRKEYPIRREFQNTILQNVDLGLSEKLTSLGFRLF